MTLFHDFTTPLAELFAGNLLLFLCSLFYLVWWIVTFGPDAAPGPGGTLCIAAALITGIAAIALMSAGIRSLSLHSAGLPLKNILIGAAVLYVVLLFVTSAVFHRQVTSELLILHIWAALELCAVFVLQGTGRFGSGRTAGMTAAIGIASVVGLICYLLYYRLEGVTAYRVGMVPLATDAVVMAVFLGMLALS